MLLGPPALPRVLGAAFAPDELALAPAPVRESRLIPRPPLDWGTRASAIRSAYRVFGDAVYRFFRSNTAPPVEGDTPFASNATLPHEPVDVFADGTWWLSMSRFNGVLDSGFAPIGPNGESFLRLDLASAAVVGSPPQGPLSLTTELRPGGVVRVIALYHEGVATRADDWVINATYDGSAPAEDSGSPTAVEAITANGIAFLSYDLPAQANGVTVKVRVQLRRTDSGPTEVWSEGSTAQIQTVTADATGPAAPAGGVAWRGALPGGGA